MEISHSGGLYFLIFLIVIFGFLWMARRQELIRYQHRVEEQKKLYSHYLEESKKRSDESIASLKEVNREIVELNRDALIELRAIRKSFEKKKT